MEDIALPPIRSRWFDVTSYGVLLTDSKTHKQGIQAAVDAASEAGGGTVWFPEGRYELTLDTKEEAALHVNADYITLKGLGRASVISITNTEVIPISIMGKMVQIQDLRFEHDQPPVGPGWAPRFYKTTIQVLRSNGTTLRNLSFRNPTICITATGVGNLTIKGITGQPLSIGIQIESPGGTVDISDVNFVGGWSDSKYVLDYTYSHLLAISTKSVSFPGSKVIFDSIIAVQCLSGFTFSGLGVGYGNLTNIDIRNSSNASCVYGISIVGSDIKVNASDYMFSGLRRAEDGTISAVSSTNACSVFNEGNAPATWLSIVGFIVIGAGKSALQADGNVTAVLEDIQIQDWGRDGTLDSPIPALLINLGRCYLLRNCVFRQSDGSSLPSTGGTGKVYGL